MAKKKAIVEQQTPETEVTEVTEVTAPVEAETVEINVDIVQAGTVSAKSKVSTGNCADYPVVFPEPFAEGSVPTVVAGLVSASTAARYGVCACAVVDGSVTNKGFTIRFYNGDVSSRLPGFSYIASGTVTRQGKVEVC